MLGPHAHELVAETAEMLWREHPGADSAEFLDLWLAAVTATTQREEEEAERLRQITAQAEETARQAEEARLQRLRAEAERKSNFEQARQADQDRRRVAEARARIGFLYNITSIANLESIASRGILCHDEATKIAHDDVSDRGLRLVFLMERGRLDEKRLPSPAAPVVLFDAECPSRDSSTPIRRRRASS